MQWPLATLDIGSPGGRCPRVLAEHTGSRCRSVQAEHVRTAPGAKKPLHMAWELVGDWGLAGGHPPPP